MVTPEFVFTNIGVNLIPILLVSIPLLFLRKGIKGVLYRRIYYGIVIFYGVYFLLPIIFQLDPSKEDSILYNGGHGSDPIAGIMYMISRTFSVVINYFQLSLINLAFIFVASPFFSMIFLWYRLRQDPDGGFRDKLKNVTLELKKSPKEFIREKLLKGDMSEEKQLFKLLIVLLPISMYLLTTILKIAGLELANPLEGGKDALGWFIEVFFVYLATFLYAMYILKAGNTAYKGTFIGESIVNNAASSLISVGTPISILSIILFIVEYSASMPLILYFFGYFIMAAVIFVSYIAIFEPICILILIKIINTTRRKERKEQPHRIETETDSLQYLLPIIFGALAAIIIIIAATVLQILANMATGGGNILEYTTGNPSDPSSMGALINATQTFEEAQITELIQIIFNSGFIIIALAVGYLLGYTYRNTKRLGLSTVLFIFTLSALVLLLRMAPVVFGGDVQWITGKLVYTNVFTDRFPVYTFRTAFVEANSENIILLTLAIPYNTARYTVSFIMWGLAFYYVRQKFFTKIIKREKYVDQITFSMLEEIPTFGDFMQKYYLITVSEDFLEPGTDREEIIRLFNMFKKGKTNRELLLEDPEENKRLYITLRYMTKQHWIKWWVPEYSFTFERAELDSLYVMYSDGRDVFSYNFSERSKADPALVAGMFSAITSFIKETTRSQDYLRTIDHGDSKITIEYGKYVFGAIFANMVTSEIRSKLKRFIEEFEKRHEKELVNWNGNTGPFANDGELVKEIFEIE